MVEVKYLELGLLLLLTCALPSYIAMTIFVGNLNYKASTEELKAFFQQRWNVKSVTIPRDRETGQTRGFAFVELATKAEEEEAINVANGQEFMGRPLRLEWARPRRDELRQGPRLGLEFREGRLRW
jgi:RNA recognition motif-containing protein